MSVISVSDQCQVASIVIINSVVLGERINMSNSNGSESKGGAPCMLALGFMLLNGVLIPANFGMACLGKTILFQLNNGELPNSGDLGLYAKAGGFGVAISFFPSIGFEAYLSTFREKDPSAFAKVIILVSPILFYFAGLSIAADGQRSTNYAGYELTMVSYPLGLGVIGGLAAMLAILICSIKKCCNAEKCCDFTDNRVWMWRRTVESSDSDSAEYGHNQMPRTVVDI